MSAPNKVLISGGIERTYDLYDPYPNIEAKRPLVVVLHGHTGSSQKIMNEHNPNRAWLDVAGRENFIVVIPNGLVGPDGFTGWNDCRKDNTTNTDTDDLGFIKLLILTLIREKKVDPERVYLTGTSNGGHLSLRVALEAPELIAAAAPVLPLCLLLTSVRPPKNQFLCFLSTAPRILCCPLREDRSEKKQKPKTGEP